MAFIKPFRMGDIVKVKGEEYLHIVNEVVLIEGVLQYSTNVSAWHGHDELTLIKECNSQSMQQLIADIEKEDEGE